MEILLQDSSASRASLSRSTGLSKQTMSEVIRLLTDRGWVRESGIISGGVGRTAVRYEVNARAALVLGLDVGSSTIRGAISDITGAILVQSETAADPRGGMHLVDQITQMKSRLLAMCDAPEETMKFATVATPGVIDRATGKLDLAPNLPGIGDLDFADSVSKSLNCKTIFENDVNAAALGEYWEAGPHAEDHFALVSLGTGIGLGILVGGALLRGGHFAAGEIGYLPLGSDPFMPLSLERGALECAIGAAGIVQRYALAGGAAGLKVHEIFERYTLGERAALVTIQETARLATLLVLTVSAVIDPDRIVFGGNIGGRPELVALINAQLPQVTQRPLRVESGRLGANATVIGAAAIALGDMHNSLFSASDQPKRIGLPLLRR
jgi:predicted NBD/HSP70 family sugar kinase